MLDQETELKWGPSPGDQAMSHSPGTVPRELPRDETTKGNDKQRERLVDCCLIPLGVPVLLRSASPVFKPGWLLPGPPFCFTSSFLTPGSVSVELDPLVLGGFPFLRSLFHSSEISRPLCSGHTPISHSSCEIFPM